MRLGDREMGRVKDKRLERRFPSREGLGVGFMIKDKRQKTKV